METTNFTFFEDAAHGWLRVELTVLKSLKISEKITPFSYMDNRFVYLEEDLDLSTFIIALADTKGIKQNTETFKYWLESFWNSTSRVYKDNHYSIRNLSSFKS